jgi:hypothetical protein
MVLSAAAVRSKPLEHYGVDYWITALWLNLEDDSGSLAAILGRTVEISGGITGQPGVRVASIGATREAAVPYGGVILDSQGTARRSAPAILYARCNSPTSANCAGVSADSAIQ